MIKVYQIISHHTRHTYCLRWWYGLAILLYFAAVIQCGTVFDAVKLQVAREFCPHHVSHYLGMDVHDTDDIKRSIKLCPGMVVTVEPGTQRCFVDRCEMQVFGHTDGRTIFLDCNWNRNWSYRIKHVLPQLVLTVWREREQNVVTASYMYRTLIWEKESKMFFVVSSIKLRRFWWNLVYSFIYSFVNLSHLLIGKLWALKLVTDDE